MILHKVNVIKESSGGLVRHNHKSLERGFLKIVRVVLEKEIFSSEEREAHDLRERFSQVRI